MPSYLELAQQKIERGIIVAKKDNSTFSTRSFKISPKGYVTVDGKRISKDDAIAGLAEVLKHEAQPQVPEPKKAKAPKGPLTFGNLNQQTRDYFYELCEQMVTISQDADNSVPVRTGSNFLSIPPKHQPRLTYLKKVGVIEKCQGNKASHKMLRLTESGQALWKAHA